MRVLTAGPGLIASMTGKAGTGKSTTLNTCRLAWEAAGKTVIGTAIQGKTADELSATSGIKKSRTVDSWLFLWNAGWLPLTKNHVVILDEAGMVPTKKMAELVKFVEAGQGEVSRLRGREAAPADFRRGTVSLDHAPHRRGHVLCLHDHRQAA